MDLSQLNDMQRKAAEHIDGPLLVLAGAGSGKTRVLTYRIANMIEKGVNPRSILALTFTNKAASEMKERIEALCGGQGHEVTAGTFHSFCARLLRRDIASLGYGENFSIYDEKDTDSVVKECLKELSIDEKELSVSYVKKCIGDAKNKLLSPAQYAQYAEERLVNCEIYEVFGRYENKLKAMNALDFDDLLVKTVKLFQIDEHVLDKYSGRYQYINIDEYQDTNLAQYELIKLLASNHKNICVVGDDDQSIYGWRGADIRNILEFENDIADVTVIRLEQNYRSTRYILDAANHVIVNNESRKGKNLWTAKKSGEKIKFFRARDEWDEARVMCRTVRQLMDECGYKYHDFAVLYRANAQSRVIEETFLEYGLPYRVYGGMKFYDRKEIKDLTAYLRVINNPDDDVSLKRIINVPRRGIGGTTVDTLSAYCVKNDCSLFDALDEAGSVGLKSGAVKKIGEFLGIIKAMIAHAAILPLDEFVEKLIRDIGFIDSFKPGNPEDEARIENVREFLGSVRQYVKSNPEAELRDYLENVALITELDRADYGTEAVTLMTMHSAKGLEFKVVFIAAMEEGIFPSQRSTAEQDRYEEERRLCYVGITRARERLFLSNAVQRNLYGSTNYNLPSQFLREIPVSCLEVVYDASASQQPSRGELRSPVANKVTPEYRLKPLKAPSTGKYSVGSKVTHKKFGHGTVITVSGDNLTVAFVNGVGVKKILAEYVD